MCKLLQNQNLPRLAFRRTCQALALSCALVWAASPAQAVELQFNPAAFINAAPSAEISAEAAQAFNEGWLLTSFRFPARLGEAALLLQQARELQHPYATISLLYLRSLIEKQRLNYDRVQVNFYPALKSEDTALAVLAVLTILDVTDYLQSHSHLELLEILDKAIAKNYVPAYFVKGKLLISIRHEPEGYAFIKQSAHQGFAPAKYFYAHAMAEGDIDLDVKLMISWLQDAIAAGYVAALYDLGQCVLKGQGMPANRDRALEYLRLAWHYGDSRAAVAVGNLLLKDKHPNYVEAFSALNFAWQNGDKRAAQSLSHLYMEGLGVAQNQAHALSLMKINVEAQ